MIKTFSKPAWVERSIEEEAQVLLEGLILASS